MKFAKLYTVLAAAVAVAGLSSCSENTDPKYHEPNAESFKIYTPAFQNDYYRLHDGGTFDVVLNGQPDYGFSAVAQYRLQVSTTQDFAAFETLTPTGTGTLSRMTLKDADLAMALCKLHGVESPDQYVDLGEQVVYLRGQAFISGVEGSEVVTSNVTSLNRVQSYLKLPIPGVIYVIGNYVGDWIGPEAANEAALAPYTLSEKPDEIDSKKYYGTIGFTADNCIFRFYTALEGWDANSLGCAGGPDSDTPVEFPDFVAGSTLEHGLAKTKDSFSFPNYTGSLEFFVDLSDSANPKVVITAPQN